MVDDLTQQPTDIPQDSQIPQVPETPQEPQPVETPPIQEPIVQEPVQPSPITTAPEETLTVPIEPVIPTSSETQSPESTQIFETPLSSPITPITPTEPIPIPQLRFPFNGSFPLTFSFGQQSDNEEIKKKFQEWGINGHHGLDFGLPEGTEVLSVDLGKIIQSGNNADFGISVTIQHPWGQSLYAHLKESKVNLDQEVNAGDVIALSGQSGAAFGAHLHFGIKPNNPDQNNDYLGFVDPLSYFPQISPIPPITPTEPQSSEPFQTLQTPEVLQEPVVEVPILTEAEVDRRAQEKLLAELEVRRQKANQTRQNKKNENLVEIEKLIQKKGKINNDDVCDFLHVSQSTASNYLKDLVNQGKIKTEGKAKATIYQSFF